MTVIGNVFSMWMLYIRDTGKFFGKQNLHVRCWQYVWAFQQSRKNQNLSSRIVWRCLMLPVFWETTTDSLSGVSPPEFPYGSHLWFIRSAKDSMWSVEKTRMNRNSAFRLFRCGRPLGKCALPKAALLFRSDSRFFFNNASDVVIDVLWRPVEMPEHQRNLFIPQFSKRLTPSKKCFDRKILDFHSSFSLGNGDLPSNRVLDKFS